MTFAAIYPRKTVKKTKGGLMKVVAPLTMALLLLSSCSTQKPYQGKARPNGTKPGKKNNFLYLAKELEDTNKQLESHPRSPSLWEKKGKLCYRLAVSGKGYEYGTGFFEAATSLRKAIALGSKDFQTHLTLVKILRKTGRSREALEIGEKAIELAKTGEERGRAFLEAGMAANERLREISKEKPNAPEIKDLARKAVAYLLKAGRIEKQDPNYWIFLSNSYAWLGNREKELETLERGLEDLPGSTALQKYYQDVSFKRKSVERVFRQERRLLERTRGNPVVLWFTGRAAMALAEEKRRRGDKETAKRLYKDAMEFFRDSYKRKKEFEASSRISISYCLLGIACLEIENNELRSARKHLMEAFDAWPKIFDSPDTFGMTYLKAMGEIGKLLLGGSRGFLSPRTGKKGPRPGLKERKQKLQMAIAHFQHLIQKHKDRKDCLGYWYNNLGLACRDLGSITAREKGRGPGSPPREAVDLWERSYDAYTKATKYCPDDPRIINDCALILVYHLGRDLKKAEGMFKKAIALGTRMLLEKKKKGILTGDEREFLEEAVGDAWQNLGIL